MENESEKNQSSENSQKTELKEALEKSSAHNSKLLIIYLLAMAYILVIVLSTTDRQLLIQGSNVTLPILNVELSLFRFYVWAPFIVLIIHLNLLYNLEKHSWKFEAWCKPDSDPKDPSLLSPFLPNSLLYSIRREQHKLNLNPLVTTIWSIFFFLPIGVLSFIQWTFSKYHSMGITSIHFSCAVIDLLFFFIFWRKIFNPEPSKKPGDSAEELKKPGQKQKNSGRISQDSRRRIKAFKSIFRFDFSAMVNKCIAGLIGVIVLLLVSNISFLALIKIFTDEDSYRFFNKWRTFIPHLELVGQTLVASSPSGDILQRYLAMGEKEEKLYMITEDVLKKMTDEENLKKNKIINVLIKKYKDKLKNINGLTPMDKDDFLLLLHETIKASSYTEKLLLLELAEVKNEGTQEITGVEKNEIKIAKENAWRDFGEGLNLQDRDLRLANFSKSNLKKADLRNAKLQGANLVEAQLQSANLNKADLRLANLNSAKLNDAQLGSAQLQGVNLLYASLEKTYLAKAQLQGADLLYANLQGAYMVESQLQGAVLFKAILKDAILESAALQGADLGEADLQDAILNKAKLQCADFGNAKMMNANLAEANLQGANLTKAQLLGANLERANLQNAILKYANLTNAILKGTNLQDADLKEAVLAGSDLTGAILHGVFLTEAQVRPKDLPEEPSEFEISLKNAGAKIIDPERTKLFQRDMKLIAAQQELACKDKYIAKGILRQLLFDKNKEQPKLAIINYMESNCPNIYQEVNP